MTRRNLVSISRCITSTCWHCHLVSMLACWCLHLARSSSACTYQSASTAAGSSFYLDLSASITDPNFTIFTFVFAHFDPKPFPHPAQSLMQHKRNWTKTLSVLLMSPVRLVPAVRLDWKRSRMYRRTLSLYRTWSSWTLREEKHFKDNLSAFLTSSGVQLIMFLLSCVILFCHIVCFLVFLVSILHDSEPCMHPRVWSFGY